MNTLMSTQQSQQSMPVLQQHHRVNLFAQGTHIVDFNWDFIPAKTETVSVVTWTLYLSLLQLYFCNVCIVKYYGKLNTNKIFCSFLVSILAAAALVVTDEIATLNISFLSSLSRYLVSKNTAICFSAKLEAVQKDQFGTWHMILKFSREI